MARSKPVIIECDLQNLSSEAHDWLENSTQDLAWTQREYRKWDELIPNNDIFNLMNNAPLPLKAEALKHYYNNFQKYGQDAGDPFVINHSIDAVFFVSNKDAMFFKMRFM